MPVEQVAEKIKRVESLGWEASIQGRKLYLVPSAVNKRAAVEHIRHQIGNVPVVASGDSLLDRCLLDFADYAVPQGMANYTARNSGILKQFTTNSPNNPVFCRRRDIELCPLYTPRCDRRCCLMTKTRIYFNRWFSVAYHYMNMIRNNEDGMQFEIYGTHSDPNNMALQACDHAELEPKVTGKVYRFLC